MPETPSARRIADTRARSALPARGEAARRSSCSAPPTPIDSGRGLDPVPPPGPAYCARSSLPWVAHQKAKLRVPYEAS